MPRWRDQDLCLTVLDTRPRLLVALDRLGPYRRDYIPVEEYVAFSTPIAVSALEGTLGVRLPSAPNTVDDDLADDILISLGELFADPPALLVQEGAKSRSSCRFRHPALRAIVLLRSGGRCEACDRLYGTLLDNAGMAALEAHHLEALSQRAASGSVTTSPDQLVAVCGGCHNILHTEDGITLEQLKAAWGQADRPQCPSCGAQQSLRLRYGLQWQPPGPGEYDAGCDVTGNGPEWHCAVCLHRW
jgi:hypothetical protein